MNTLDQRLGAWSGLVFTLMFFIGLGLAGWLPLPSPSLSVDEVVAMYSHETNLKRVGMMILMLGVGFFLPFTAVISHQLRRIGHSSTLPNLQMIAGTANSVTILLPPVVFATTAFRLDRNPESLFALNDLAWMILAAPGSPAIMQSLAIGVAVLMDRRSEPLFPRWFAYLNFWAAATYVCGGLAFFFKSGPFAWNGLITFYLPASAFFTWIICMIVLLLRAIRSEERAATGDSVAGSPRSAAAAA